jgi:hypothetical protein
MAGGERPSYADLSPPLEANLARPVASGCDDREASYLSSRIAEKALFSETQFPVRMILGN